MRNGSDRIAAGMLVAALLLAVPLAAQNTPPDAAQPPARTAPSPAPSVDPGIGPIRRVGNGVLPPRLTYKVDPKFSKQAADLKQGGVVLVQLIVDANGMPRNVHILRGVGYGLDESAMAAVKQYTFAPATENGKPVAVLLNVEVNFQVFDKRKDVSETPKILHSVPLELTDEARRAHASGAIVVAFIVDRDGTPQNVHIERGVGMGMDERAVEALQQYKFEPFQDANGQPMARPATLELKFDAK